MATKAGGDIRPASGSCPGTMKERSCSLVDNCKSDAHYRNLYKERLDFRAVAKEDHDLAAVLKGGHLDFHDPRAVVQLTKTLLRRDFGLRVELPDDRLCPPVPNRHNYILWLKALVDSTTGSYKDEDDDYGDKSGNDRKVLGLDIGTGASCIYPLLGCAQRRNWHFLATDVDAKSVEWARANVARNGLEQRIRVVARPSAEAPLIPLLDDSAVSDLSSIPRLDFVMVNPPFYASAVDMISSAKLKELPPHSVCTGAPVEMVYQPGGEGQPGGEVAFVGRLVDESAILRERVTWYTAMLGKLSSLVAVVERLRSSGIDNYAVAAFVQGSKTRRWAVAWSCGARRPAAVVARGGLSDSPDSSLDAIRRLLPPSTEVDSVWSVPRADLESRGGIGALAGRLDMLMSSLELTSWAWDQQRLRGVGQAPANVWGRAWRRRKLREEKDKAGAGESATVLRGESDVIAGDGPAASRPPEECALGFAVAIRMGVADTTVSCRWAEGHSEALFQSFCGFLKTRLSAKDARGEV